VEGSYPQRLFKDPDLLRKKLVEEAQELVEATEPEHVAAECADVLYFAMVRLVAAGATMEQVGEILDRRALKVTRRPGNAKAYRTEAADAILKK
jgi:phosphoribosyl-ATP pyrophosphohydrolase/phosphoribosyl-AMP cyclohydrolase/histidinol dehydrogenase